jgi:hypothetical protein
MHRYVRSGRFPVSNGRGSHEPSYTYTPNQSDGIGLTTKITHEQNKELYTHTQVLQKVGHYQVPSIISNMQNT